MKIYTKTGDRGDTGLFGGVRVSKADARVHAYGEVDELNAVLGLARTTALGEGLDALLQSIQSELFTLGAELATVPGKEASLGLALIDEPAIARLERAIDAADAELTPLKNFVLPGGAPSAAFLHLARTVCRRAERQVVALAGHEPVRASVVQYLNRLSDLLFTLARLANHRAAVVDIPWAPHGERTKA